MSGVRYQAVITGESLVGFELEQVKAEFSAKFSLSIDQVEALFSQPGKVIKKGLSSAKSEKFLEMLTHMGVQASIVDEYGNVIRDNLGRSEEQAAYDEAAKPLVSESPSDSGFMEAGFPQTENNVESTNSDAVAEEESSFDQQEGYSVEPMEQTEQPSVEKEEDSELQTYPFVFTGNGWEYFKIWIVNILLSIVTLGIYSAWAKVRNHQYFYGHTSIAGSSFSYLAKPLTILKGRLIAIAVLVFTVILSNITLLGAALVYIGIIVALPWVVIRSLKFQTRMSAWRNVTFGFDGEVKGAVKAYILWYFVAVVSFGLLLPFALYKQTEFVLGNLRFGGSKFTFEPCMGNYVKIFYMAIGIVIAAGLLNVGIKMVAPVLTFFGALLMLVAYLALFVVINVRIGNLVYSSMSMENEQITFDSDLEEKSFAIVFVKNLFLMIVTLGLYIPFAKVNLMHYHMSRLQMSSTISLDNFYSVQEEKVSVLGEELGEAFDLQIGI